MSQTEQNYVYLSVHPSILYHSFIVSVYLIHYYIIVVY